MKALILCLLLFAPSALAQYTYNATVLRVVDCDSIEMSADLGFYMTYRSTFRVDGIDCPELNTQAGKDAKAWTESVLKPGMQVLITTAKADKYGRWLARITLPDGSGYATLALTNGHARAYAGGAR